MSQFKKLLVVGLLAGCSAESVDTSPGAGAGGKADEAAQGIRLSGRSLFFSESVEDRITHLTLSPSEEAADLYRVVAQRSASAPLGGGPAQQERVIGERMSCFVHGIDLSCSQDDTAFDGPRVGLTVRSTDGGLSYEAIATSFNPWTSQTTTDRIAGHLSASGLCGDGGPALCEIVEPNCPDGTVLTVENGCFGPCVNPVSCEAPPAAPAPTEAYEPCADKACGDDCTICPPDADDCFETAVIKLCQPDGECRATVPECSAS